MKINWSRTDLTPARSTDDEYQIRENNAAYNSYFVPEMDVLGAIIRISGFKILNNQLLVDFS